MNPMMRELGARRSVIRELFEYGTRRKQEIGAENVFDFSLGNPSVPAPEAVRAELVRLLNETPAVELHGYTTAAGDPGVRRAIADYLNRTYGAGVDAKYMYLTVGAAASLTISLTAIGQPISWQIVRYGISVTPAIGASIAPHLKNSIIPLLPLHRAPHPCIG